MAWQAQLKAISPIGLDQVEFLVDYFDDSNSSVILHQETLTVTSGLSKAVLQSKIIAIGQQARNLKTKTDTFLTQVPVGTKIDIP